MSDTDPNDDNQVDLEAYRQVMAVVEDFLDKLSVLLHASSSISGMLKHFEYESPQEHRVLIMATMLEDVGYEWSCFIGKLIETMEHHRAFRIGLLAAISLGMKWESEGKGKLVLSDTPADEGADDDNDLDDLLGDIDINLP